MQTRFGWLLRKFSGSLIGVHEGANEVDGEVERVEDKVADMSGNVEDIGDTVKISATKCIALISSH